MRQLLRRVATWYVRFAEKQGFPIIITVCVGVIAATALWTGRAEPAYVSPTPPVGQSISAAQLQQQSLWEAHTPIPHPSTTPRVWQPPVEDAEVIRAFSPETFFPGHTTGVWQLHDALDLSCQPGEQVCTIADGRIIDCGKSDLLGVWLSIDHGDGILAVYSGMSLSGPYLAGDSVKAGTVIGYAGQGPLDEQDMPPHLHLRVTRNGQAIDPSTLWTE